LDKSPDDSDAIRAAAARIRYRKAPPRSDAAAHQIRAPDASDAPARSIAAPLERARSAPPGAKRGRS
jgi:hypothetical protein